ncbi:TIGR02611 family protein [Kineococcus sp. TBRC 1896]|uniref:TIGR02611 family protein n=1 Tax=Kineococcus mangrovi TaxID=1660183 RepID=A0ABV4I2J9_9ACTN
MGAVRARDHGAGAGGEDDTLPGPRLPDPPHAPQAVQRPVDARAVGPDAAAEAARSARRHRTHRLRASLHARREVIRADVRRNRLYRAGVGAVGTAVVVVGLALVPLPGPGWLVVFTGLAVLGSEFSSAQRLKHFGERQVHRWARWVLARSLTTRAALGAGTVAVVAAAVWGWLAWQGLPAWTPEVVTAQLQRVPGLRQG